MLSRRYIIKYSGESIEDLSAIVSHYGEISALLKVRLRDSVTRAEADLLRNPLAFSKSGLKISGASF